AYLLRRGHDVRVLTAAPLPYPPTLPADTGDDRIVRARSADPFACLAARRTSRRSRNGTSQAPSLIGNGWRGRMLRSVGAVLAIPEPQIGWVPFCAVGGPWSWG